MENVSNISSEEELLQLHNEGKITEGEYQQLLNTMRKPLSDDVALADEAAAPGTDKAKSKRKLGKIAFVLMFVGMIFPLVALALAAATAGGERAEAARKQAISADIADGQEKAAQEAEQRAEQLRRALKDKQTRMLITIGSCLVLGLVLWIAALVFGVISWPDVYGKATVITVSAVAVLTLVFALLFAS